MEAVKTLPCVENTGSETKSPVGLGIIWISAPVMSRKNNRSNGIRNAMRNGRNNGKSDGM